MESFVSELAQEVRCSLCNDRFLEPKLLKCFHTYCKACIKRHAELLEGRGNIFKCPECLAETSLPELNDVEDLNPSPLHTRIVKVLEFVESEKVCSVSKIHPAASWYCFDCSCSLCSDCQSCHLMFSKNSHKVACLSNLKKEDLEFMLAKEDDCGRHGGYKLEFFCQDCDALICLECLKLDHRDHKTILHEKHATTVKESLEEQLKRLSIQEDQMFSGVEVLENFAVKIKDKGGKAIQEIQAKAKEIIEKVQQSEQELIKEIREQIDNSEQQKKKGLNVLDKTRSAKSFVTQLIEKRLPASHMKNVKDLVRPISDDVVPSVQEDSRVVFVPSEECGGLLKVELGKLIHLKSYVAVPATTMIMRELKTNETICEKNCNISNEEEISSEPFGTNDIAKDKKESTSRSKMATKRERKIEKRKERERRLKGEEDMQNAKTENENETKQVGSTQAEYSIQRTLYPWWLQRPTEN